MAGVPSTAASVMSVAGTHVTATAASAAASTTPFFIGHAVSAAAFLDCDEPGLAQRVALGISGDDVRARSPCEVPHSCELRTVCAVLTPVPMFLRLWLMSQASCKHMVSLWHTELSEDADPTEPCVPSSV